MPDEIKVGDEVWVKGKVEYLHVGGEIDVEIEGWHVLISRSDVISATEMAEIEGGESQPQEAPNGELQK